MGDRSETIRGPARMWLTVFSGERPERTVEITGDRFLVGRGESCDLVIDDPRVSREHAAITPGFGMGRLLYDLDSANGTLVNGQQVTMPPGFTGPSEKVAEINGGEWIRFGDTVVLATLADPRSGQPEQSG